MELTSLIELNVTREKLRRLEALYDEQERAPAKNPFVKEVSQASLKRVIQQFRDEIARFEAKARLINRPDSSSQAESSVSSTGAG